MCIIFRNVITTSFGGIHCLSGRTFLDIGDENNHILMMTNKKANLLQDSSTRPSPPLLLGASHRNCRLAILLFLARYDPFLRGHFSLSPRKEDMFCTVVHSVRTSAALVSLSHVWSAAHQRGVVLILPFTRFSSTR